MNGEVSFSYSLEAAYDLNATLSLLMMGRNDPCLRVDGPGQVRVAIAGPSGSLVVEMHQRGGQLDVSVMGPDAEWLVPMVPSLLGLGFSPPLFNEPRRLRLLARKFAGLRLPRLPIVFPRLVQIVLQQLVSYRDAWYGWRQLVLRHGEAILGQNDLMAPPSAQL